MGVDQVLILASAFAFASAFASTVTCCLYLSIGIVSKKRRVEYDF